MGHLTSDELLVRANDAPSVGKDLLLEALIREFGPGGRPDIAVETVPRAWVRYARVDKPEETSNVQ